jgi:hypothetical protein
VGSLLAENMTSALGRRINVCFVCEEDILLEIVDGFVFVLAAIFCS